jgi:hypothetical protein
MTDHGELSRLRLLSARGRCVPESNELLPLFEQLASEVCYLVAAYEQADRTLQAGGVMAAVLDAQMEDVRAAYARLAQAHHVLRTVGPKRRETRN